MLHKLSCSTSCRGGCTRTVIMSAVVCATCNCSASTAPYRTAQRSNVVSTACSEPLFSDLPHWRVTFTSLRCAIVNHAVMLMVIRTCLQVMTRTGMSLAHQWNNHSNYRGSNGTGLLYAAMAPLPQYRGGSSKRKRG